MGGWSSPPVRAPSPVSPQLPVYAALRARGRQVRLQLQALLAEEAALDERFYLKALQLPNRTHPEAVSWGGVVVVVSPRLPAPPDTWSSPSRSGMRAKPVCWRWWERSQVRWHRVEVIWGGGGRGGSPGAERGSKRG